MADIIHKGRSFVNRQMSLLENDSHRDTRLSTVKGSEHAY